MAHVGRVLFVCTGNICRSAMAEQLLRHLSKERGLGIEVRSCGTATEAWFPVPEVVRRLLEAKGLPPFTHRARPVSREELRWADLVLVMTARHAQHLGQAFPEFRPKVRLMRQLAGFGAEDVEDPFNKPEDAFVRCLAVLDQTLEALVARDFREPGQA